MVASSYNGEYVEPMVGKAREELLVIEPNSRVAVVQAPGSFEIPFLTKQVIEKQKPDAVICLGVIFRGETGHADLVAASVTEALCRLSVETSTPVIHAVLLLSDESQARERCLEGEANRGTEAARAAIEAIRAARSITPR